MPEGLYLQPVIVATKRVNTGGKFKGGVPSYSKVRDEVMRLLHDSSATSLSALRQIRNNFPTPEEINDDPATAPSARLQNLYPRYSKPFFGSLIASRIGVDPMLLNCKHFAAWVSFLRSL